MKSNSVELPTEEYPLRYRFSLASSPAVPRSVDLGEFGGLDPEKNVEEVIEYVSTPTKIPHSFIQNC